MGKLDIEDAALQVERSAWRVCRADQAGVLVDAAAYFRAARRAILAAELTAYLVGWDLHSATRLIRGDDCDVADGDARTLREVLARAVERHPALRIYVLLWDWAVFYAGERELLPRLNLDWRLPESVRLELDGAVPIGASQHQKLVVVDDQIAFCGGLDLTVRRWDRREHRPDDPQRVDHEGRPFSPYHDVQLAVTGEAAAALGGEVRRRWRAATGETLAPPGVGRRRAGAPPAIPDAAVTLAGMRAAIVRTVPDSDPQRQVTEVRDSLLAMIAGADDYIYIENQFVCADLIGRALAERLRENPRLQVLIVTPRRHKGWLESRSMGAGRTRFMQHLAAAKVLERARLVYPVHGDGERPQDTFIHSKVMIVDDRMLRVGSANLNNRSLGFDSECDVILLARDSAERCAVAAVLCDLLGEHLAVDPDAVAEALARRGLLGGVRALNRRAGRLETLEPPPADLSLPDNLYINLADPEQPVSLGDFLPLVSDEHSAGRRRPSIVPLAAGLLLLAGLAAAWRYTPVAELARPEALEALLNAARTSPWSPLLVCAIYLLGGFLMLPVTGLILATGVVFDAPAALGYALGGSLLSAAAGYLAGCRCSLPLFRRAAHGRLRRIVEAVHRRGLLAMATVRLIPVAPFMVVNVVAGAAGIRFRDYLLGTALGMAPGIVVLTAFGRSLGSLLQELTWGHLAQAAGLALLWIVLMLGARRLLRVDPGERE